jgi:alkylation response protein AidB-like acyl-CoA dehydrogenase
VLLNPTPDQSLLQETTSTFLDELVPPAVLRQLRDDGGGEPEGYWTRGAELGWSSLLVGEADGGGAVGEHGLVDLTLIAYEFGRHAAPGPLAPTNIVAAILSQRGGGAHADTVASLVAGSATAAWCLAEPAPNDRLGAWSLDVRVEGDEVVLNRTKRPVEAAPGADLLLVTGRTDGGLTNVLVPASTSGVTVRTLRSPELSRRYGSVEFTDVRLPLSALVGETGAGDGAVEWGLLIGRTIAAAESVGAMQAAFDMTVEWAFDRYSFGRPLSSYQALKHRFADMKSWLEAAHAIADATALAAATGDPIASDSAMAAAAFIGEYGTELAHDCVQIHGGIGVTFEHDLHFYLRRIVANRSTYGSPAELRQLLADSLEQHAVGDHRADERTNDDQTVGVA